MEQTLDEHTVGAHMAALYRAFREADVGTLDQIFADEFTFSDPNGPVMSKEKWLADIERGDLIFDEIETGPVSMRHLGDQVLVDGEARLRVRYTESNYNGRFRYLGVFAREGERWRLRLTSAVRIEEPTGSTETLN